MPQGHGPGPGVSVCCPQEIDDAGAVAPARALTVALDVARGLAATHQCGVVHRDVKPSNVLVRQDGSACLTDFGLVRMSGTEEARLTATGEIVGTVNYMAPEQFRDPRRVTPQSDVYSLGATLFHALSGMPPFAGEPIPAIAMRLVRGEVPAFDARLTGPPAELISLVRRMMAVDPAARFADGRALVPAIIEGLKALHGIGRNVPWREDTEPPLPD